MQWQSALWAVVALGLNAMTQRSGGDLISSPYIISLIRSSPFICGVDTVMSIAWLLTGWYYGESPTSSIRLRSMGTKLMMGDAEDDKSSDGKPEPERLPVIGAIFFILGPLPQAVKLAGVGGAIGTMAMGMAFTISYLLRVWELYLHKHAKQPHPVPKMPWHVRQRLKAGAEWLYTYAYTIQGMIWLQVCYELIRHIRPPLEGSLSSSNNDEDFDYTLFLLLNMCLLTPSLFFLFGVCSGGKKYIGRPL
jgi:hypothetical protein